MARELSPLLEALRSRRHVSDCMARASGVQRSQPPSPSTVTSTRVRRPSSSADNSNSCQLRVPAEPGPLIVTVTAIRSGGSNTTNSTCARNWSNARMNHDPATSGPSDCATVGPLWLAASRCRGSARYSATRYGGRSISNEVERRVARPRTRRWERSIQVAGQARREEAATETATIPPWCRPTNRAALPELGDGRRRVHGAA